MSVSNNHELSANWYSVKKQGKEYELSDNFKLKEFQSKDGEDVVLVHPNLIEGLEDIRSHFGNKPVTIKSGYRTRKYNEKINGSDDSRHCLGLAADIVVEGVSPDKVADYAEEKGFGGVGRYNTFTHVDVWETDRRWYDR